MNIKYVLSKNYSEMCQIDKFKVVNSKKVKLKVLNYLKSHFENLKIEISVDYKGNLIELMNRGVLEGRCWETTETAILFLEDDDYIERGNLKFDKYNNYYHSWIVFKFNDIEYAFDPCLKILCKNKLYEKVFEPEIEGVVTARQVKDYFINYMANYDVKQAKEKYDFCKMFSSFFNEQEFERQRSEIVIPRIEDVNEPMYRNGVGYRAEIADDKIKKLVAHYYSDRKDF